MKFSKRDRKGNISEMRSDNLHNSDFEKAKEEIITGLVSRLIIIMCESEKSKQRKGKC